MAMLPVNQLVRMARLTSAKLRGRGTQHTTAGEVLNFIGVTVLVKLYEFGARANEWATSARNKYMLEPAFGERTGIPHSPLDALWSCVAFSEQAGDTDDSKGSRWQPIDDFFSSVNTHRSTRVSPSDLSCADESMCKLYGQGGHWKERGFPMYMSIDRKPENWCEIQNTACGRS